MMNGDLSRAEMEAMTAPRAVAWLAAREVADYASRLTPPVSWRTVERCIAAGFVDGPCSPGRGRGKGRAYLYPYRILAQLDAVAAAHRPEHARRLDPVIVANRLWWDGHRPDLFEAWCADRLDEALADHRMEEAGRGLSDAELDREVQAVAAWWRRSRVGPRRAERESVVAWIVDIFLGRGFPLDIDGHFDDGDHRTMGQVLDHGLGITAMRAQGIEVPGKPGESALAELDLIPPAIVRHNVLCQVTPEGAARARDRLVAREAEAQQQGRLIFGRNLRNAPRQAGVLLAGVLAWGGGAATIRPPAPTTCLGCDASCMASPDQLVLHCPACKGWFVRRK